MLFNGYHIYGGNKCTVADKEIVDHSLHNFFSGKISVEKCDITKKKDDINQERNSNPDNSSAEKEDKKDKKDEKEIISGGTYITDVLTEILRTEDVLDRVFRFQILDLLEIEGEWVVRTLQCMCAGFYVFCFFIIIY